MQTNTVRAEFPIQQDEGEAGGRSALASFDDLCDFIGEFVSVFMSSGGQTVRVERSVQRIGLVYGVNVETLLFYRHAVVSVVSLCNSDQHKTMVVSYKSIGHNFSNTFSLNKLSWEVFDEWLTSIGADTVPNLEKPRPGQTVVLGYCVPEDQLVAGETHRSAADLTDLRERFHAITKRKRLSDWILCPMIGVASASFCSLFAGDWMAMGIVFLASQAAFLTRRFMVHSKHMDIRLGFLAAAFVSSFLSAVGTLYLPSETPSTAVASSVLFLVPGVPLLSAVNDILNGHTLMGISRGTNAAMLTLCIAFGLAVTLMVSGFNVL